MTTPSLTQEKVQEVVTQLVVVPPTQPGNVVNLEYLTTALAGAKLTAGANLEITGQTVKTVTSPSFTKVTITGNVTSTSSTTGDLIVVGGFGLGGKLNGNTAEFAGVVKFTDGTNTFGTTATGGVQVGGGMSVTKNLTVGTNLHVNGVVNGVSGVLTVGDRLYVSNAAASTSATTGALTVAGGIGVAGSIVAGGYVSASSPVNSSHLTTKSYVDNAVANGMSGLTSLSLSGRLTLTNTETSLNDSTGALICDGGAVVKRNLFVTGQLMQKMLVSDAGTNILMGAADATDMTSGQGVYTRLGRDGNDSLETLFAYHSTAQQRYGAIQYSYWDRTYAGLRFWRQGALTIGDVTPIAGIGLTIETPTRFTQAVVVVTPTIGTHAATKSYVDTAVLTAVDAKVSFSSAVTMSLLNVSAPIIRGSGWINFTPYGGGTTQGLRLNRYSDESYGSAGDLWTVGRTASHDFAITTNSTGTVLNVGKDGLVTVPRFKVGPGGAESNIKNLHYHYHNAGNSISNDKQVYFTLPFSISGSYHVTVQTHFATGSVVVAASTAGRETSGITVNLRRVDGNGAAGGGYGGGAAGWNGNCILFLTFVMTDSTGF